MRPQLLRASSIERGVKEAPADNPVSSCQETPGSKDAFETMDQRACRHSSPARHRAPDLLLNSHSAPSDNCNGRFNLKDPSVACTESTSMGPVERACQEDQRSERAMLWLLPRRAMAPTRNKELDTNFLSLSNCAERSCSLTSPAVKPALLWSSSV